MLTALVLFNIVHPGQIMPGRDSDLPSRKQRKAMGKKNVRGRMAGDLPLYEYPGRDIKDARPAAETERNLAYPKIDGTTVSGGYKSVFES